MCSNAVAPGNIEIMSTELITISKQTFTLQIYISKRLDWLTNTPQFGIGIGMGFIYFVRIKQNIKKITYLGKDREEGEDQKENWTKWNYWKVRKDWQWEGL